MLFKLEDINGARRVPRLDIISCCCMNNNGNVLMSIHQSSLILNENLIEHCKRIRYLYIYLYSLLIEVWAADLVFNVDIIKNHHISYFCGIEQSV